MDLIAYLAGLNTAICSAAMSSAVKFNAGDKSWQVGEQLIRAAEREDGTVSFSLFPNASAEPVGQMQGVKREDALAEIAPCLSVFLFTGEVRPVNQQLADFPAP